MIEIVFAGCIFIAVEVEWAKIVICKAYGGQGYGDYQQQSEEEEIGHIFTNSLSNAIYILKMQQFYSYANRIIGFLNNL